MILSQKVELAFNDIGQQKVKNTDVHAFDLVLEGAVNRKVGSEPTSKTRMMSESLVLSLFYHLKTKVMIQSRIILLMV